MGVNLTPHFVLNNLLHSLFVSLLAYSHFIVAEVVLLANFINLTCLYFRFNTYPRFFHLPVITGPLAWTFVAIYWNGAFILPQENPVGQVIGGIFIWSILAYGMLLLLAYKVWSLLSVSEYVTSDCYCRTSPLVSLWELYQLPYVLRRESIQPSQFDGYPRS